MPIRLRALTLPVLLALVLLTSTARGAAAANTSPACGREDAHPSRLLFLPASSVDALSSADASPFHSAVATVTFTTKTACQPAPVNLRWAVADAEADDAAAQSAPPRAFSYSEGYRQRALIHKRASLAMLPLFVAEGVLGQKMFNNPSAISSTRRTAHRTIGMAIGGLFAVNSVTGVMNMWEGRKDPQGLIRRTIHGTLMLVADMGFLATAMTRPNTSTSDGLAIYDFKKNQHMALAYASITTATIGYLMMLIHR